VALDLLAIDTETTGVDWHDEAFMISVATREWSHVYDKRLCEHGKDWDEAVETVSAMLIDCDKSLCTMLSLIFRSCVA
jgi:hypothetical protein